MKKTKKENTEKSSAGGGTYSFSNENIYRKICGINDSRVRQLEKSLGVEIIPRGISFIISGTKDKILHTIEFLKKLEANFSERPDADDLDSFDLNYQIRNHKQEGSPWNPSEKILTTNKGKTIYPRTVNQEKFVQSLQKNIITFASGPAGTGKTFLSIAVASRMLQNGEVERLILTRPAVEAGESLGFLPGDMKEKVDPYLRPIYDALNECIGYEKVQVLTSLGKIEIAPIAFMRGRTLANSFIILDEAQNCTAMQLKMILTRIGKNSKMAVSGDITQIDLAKDRSGFQKVAGLLSDIPEVGSVVFGKEDITRHYIIEAIVSRLEKLL